MIASTERVRTASREAPPATQFGTKAQTLQRLRPLVRQSEVLDLVAFEVAEWKARRREVIETIRTRLGRRPLAVRSSAVREDGANESMAGQFTSCLGVNGADRRAVARAVDAVVGSYGGDPRDQVLVQPMVTAVEMSGVVMTRALDDGAPYYVVNYDDESGRTDSITGGHGVNKTVYVYRRADARHVASERVRRVLAMAAELEALYPGVPLDIEFCLAAGVLHLLQVRRVSVQAGWRAGVEGEVESRLPALEAFVEQRSLPRPGVHGSRTVLGIMPDWNPAEILGNTPHALAVSLYRHLVTRSVWREAREAMGYRTLPPEELMVVLYGRPYIDVRNSFNSLLPESLSERAAEPLVDAWIERLVECPELHDKVEFDVAQTCLDFSFRRTFRERYGELRGEVCDELEEALRDLTCCALADDGGAGSLAGAEMAIARLEELQAARADAPERPLGGAARVMEAARLLEEARELGTLPFAVTARHAFIAETLLRSAVAEGMLREERVAQLRRSVRTVSRELAEAMRAVVAGEGRPEDFLRRYGHLRPGTYDIQSPTYAQRGDLFTSAISRSVPEDESFELRPAERRALDRALRAAGLDVLDADGLMRYARRAIAGREYAKFVFTRNLSAALEELAAWGAEMGLDRDAVSHLDWEEIVRGLSEPASRGLAEHLMERVERGRAANETARAVKLGFLIRDVSDLYVVPLHRSQPNFVGQGRVSGEVAVVEVTTGAETRLEGRIAVIENADPGFDWVFSRGIRGLVTRYGGANSHMAIRCAEFGLPAAIGCGEQVHQRVIAAGAVELNCRERVIRPLDDA
ncbi:MAG TPA: PEP/pyruvate-binding domain-containing protein [Longimicrobiaceae bacterium]|nr:PEP/pyruvate-binding domain-containing protein [Longimicrobiaceae bacterium]